MGPLSRTQQFYQPLPRPSELAVRSSHQPRSETETGPAGVLHFPQQAPFELVAHQIERHPTKARTHQQSLFLRMEARQVQAALAAEKQPVRALLLIGVLHR